MPDFLLAWKYRRNFAEKMQTNVDITKLKEMVVSATDAYYNTVENDLIESGYSKSFIQEQRDRIHHSLLWMMRDDLVEVDGDTHQGTANLAWSFSSRPLYFIHDDGGIDCVDWHYEGIDYFIGVNGVFAIHKYDWSDAMREIDEHEEEIEKEFEH